MFGYGPREKYRMRSWTSMKTPVLVALGVVALAAQAADPAAQSGNRLADDRPNIVFVLADDLGWTDLRCYGSDLYQTPHIDRLAAQGMRFTSAYSACTVCSPSRAALMTGMYPARLHLTDWINGAERPYAKLKIPDWTKYLKHDYVTLAKALKAAGYLTIHAGKWHLARRALPNLYQENRSDYPLAHGFDVQFGGTCSCAYFWPYRTKEFDVGLAEGGRPGEYLTDRLTDEVLKVIESNRDRPFFVYLAHFAPHTPFQAKPDYIAKYQRLIKTEARHRNPTYAAMIESLDDSVGRIMAKLEELKIAERTLVVFTSDNGGVNQSGNPTDNTPLRAGKGTEYEGGVRVPAIVKWPGVTKPGSLCHEPIITMDWYPTCLRLAGIKGDREHDAQIDGADLRSILSDPGGRLGREAIYWHYPHYHGGGATPYGAVRAGDWKLIEFYEDMRVELYNLREDVGEGNDLAQRMPDEAARLREMLQAWRSRVGAQMPRPNPAYDAKKDAEVGFFR